MWDKADRKFLRSLRIVTDDPPVPLPRFRVEPSEIEGRWCVIDITRYRLTGRRRVYIATYDCGPDEFQKPREAAEDLARQLNEKHATKQTND